MDNKNEGRFEEGRGNVKEGVGQAIDDPQMENEGKLDQAKGNVRQGVGDIQDKLQGDDDRR
ncbi:MAG: CsbD family protein [Chloroflexi bacterium]|jgi:uncharacterized protein YjbJ (UPF0337 family)|nr:CsbD family protein [Chloroflexota bacterium]MBA3851501.1 CsbD family protein [Chloroflexota bacterium]